MAYKTKLTSAWSKSKATQDMEALRLVGIPRLRPRLLLFCSRHVLMVLGTPGTISTTLMKGRCGKRNQILIQTTTVCISDRAISLCLVGGLSPSKRHNINIKYFIVSFQLQPQ